MKAQRIRYEKKDGQLVSKHEVVSAKGVKYLVFINLETMTYLIRNTISLRKYEGGEGIKNIIVLKRKVKKHLEHLGVAFEKEVRSRTFGRCEKGYSQKKHIEQKKANEQK